MYSLSRLHLLKDILILASCFYPPFLNYDTHSFWRPKVTSWTMTSSLLSPPLLTTLKLPQLRSDGGLVVLGQSVLAWCRCCDGCWIFRHSQKYFYQSLVFFIILLLFYCLKFWILWWVGFLSLCVSLEVYGTIVVFWHVFYRILLSALLGIVCAYIRRLQVSLLLRPRRKWSKSCLANRHYHLLSSGRASN